MFLVSTNILTFRFSLHKKFSNFLFPKVLRPYFFYPFF